MASQASRRSPAAKDGLGRFHEEVLGVTVNTKEELEAAYRFLLKRGAGDLVEVLMPSMVPQES